jgi:OOP family OmpA-OmpF porin
MKRIFIGVASIGAVLFLAGCTEDTYNAFPDQPTSVAQMMGNEEVVGWTNYKKDSDKDGVADYKDKCLNTPRYVNVDKNGCAIDSDKDGVADYKDRCPHTPKGSKVNKNGCAIDSDGDKIIDLFDKCPNTPKGMKVDFNGCPILQIFRFNFKFNSYKIDKKYYSKIEKLAKFLKKNQKIKIKIEGFTDNIGSYEYNKKLSLKRANALKEILINKFKINPQRIRIAGYGEDEPIASNKTEEGRKLNRRVVVIDESQYIKGIKGKTLDCIIK